MRFEDFEKSFRITLRVKSILKVQFALNLIPRLVPFFILIKSYLMKIIELFGKKVCKFTIFDFNIGLRKCDVNEAFCKQDSDFNADSNYIIQCREERKFFCQKILGAQENVIFCIKRIFGFATSFYQVFQQ